MFTVPQILHLTPCITHNWDALHKATPRESLGCFKTVDTLWRRLTFVTDRWCLTSTCVNRTINTHLGRSWNLANFSFHFTLLPKRLSFHILKMIELWEKKDTQRRKEGQISLHLFSLQQPPVLGTVQLFLGTLGSLIPESSK